MMAMEGNRQAVATKEKAVRIKIREEREKLRTNAIVNGTLVVQFASASEELHKRFSDGVTIRSRVSVQFEEWARKSKSASVKNRFSNQSSVQNSISAKQKEDHKSYARCFRKTGTHVLNPKKKR